MRSFERWAKLIYFDFLIRLAFLFVFIGPFAIFIAALLTATYTPILAATNALETSPQLRVSLTTALAVSNFTFLLIVIGIWVAMIKGGSVTSCSDGQCAWIDGAITANGAKALVCFALAQAIANTVPLLAIHFFERRAERAPRLPS